MNSNLYILDGHLNPVRVGFDVFSKFFANADNRRVAFDVISGYEISTCFLGIDHQHEPGGKPILFETMVSNTNVGLLDVFSVTRYHTWDEAVVGHNNMINEVKIHLLETVSVPTTKWGLPPSIDSDFPMICEAFGTNPCKEVPIQDKPTKPVERKLFLPED